MRESASVMNLLLDVNVYIDYLGRRDPHFPNAQKIVMAGFFGDVRLWVPAQSVTIAFYVLTKHIGSERVQRAIEKSLELMNLVTLTTEDVRKGLRLHWRDLEDSLVAVSAEKANADFLVTRDGGDFSRSSVPAVTPSEFLQWMQDEKGLTYDEVPM